MVLKPAHLTAEKILIRLMIENRQYYNRIKEDLGREDFLNYEINILAHIIFDEYEKNPNKMNIDLNYIYDKLKDEKDLDYDLINEIMELNVELLSEDKRKLIEDLIHRVRMWKLKMDREKILKELKEIESKKQKDEGDVNRFKSLCLELTKLDKKLKSHM